MRHLYGSIKLISKFILFQLPEQSMIESILTESHVDACLVIDKFAIRR